MTEREYDIKIRQNIFKIIIKKFEIGYGNPMIIVIKWYFNHPTIKLIMEAQLSVI